MIIELLIAGLIVFFILIRIVIRSSNVDPVIYSNKNVYSDHSFAPERPFYSKRYLIAGKPDMIIKKGDINAPLEIKSNGNPAYPYKGHIMQLMSYCLLLEENKNKVEYGLLQYGNHKPVRIDYTQELRNEVLDTTEIMRKSIIQNELIVNGHDRSKCRWCINNRMRSSAAE